MDERAVELFNDSLERCMSTPGFLDRFYELFVASSEEVAQKFKNTDFRKQKRALTISLNLMMQATERNPEFHAHLERIAARHSRGQLDIKPELYELWLDCLVRAAKDFDPACDAETEHAWRSMMRVGIDFMTSKY